MSSIHDPAKVAPTLALPPATDRNVDIDNLEDDSDDDASSEISEGENLRDDLEEVLQGDFDFKGKFALSETFASAPLPGLQIQGIGPIGFPLTERDAKLIETVATQAPFGKGTETIVDTTVRDTFEINPDKFSFTNPAWSGFLQSVTKTFAEGLGLPPNLPQPRADLYKLLLYKAGSHFLPHKDTEKSQGMFASLIIILPSKFEGGQVHVSHGNDKDVFDISPTSEFTISALAWYTDVIHEVKPVTSGYRLAVSYNLVNTLPGLPPPHLPDMHSAVSAVQKIFHKWTKGGYDDYGGPEFSGTIAFLLDHQYSDASLESTALKGKDATLISNIRSVAAKEGICLRLGLLQYQINGDAGYAGRCSREHSPKMKKVFETAYRIEDMYDLEGDLVTEMIELDPELSMIPKDPGFKRQDPDNYEFEGFTGNEGAPLTHLYRRSALVMYLTQDFETLLEIGGADYALTKLKRWRAEGQTERNMQMARYILDHKASSDSWTYDQSAPFLIDLALEWGDFPMWQEVFRKSRRDRITPELSSDVLFRAWSVFSFDRTKDIIHHTIRNQPNTMAAIKLINALRARFPTQDPNMIAWWKRHTVKVLSSIEPPPTVHDLPTLMDIAKSEGLLFFSETVLKKLVGFRQMFDLWVDLAGSLWKEKARFVPSGGTPEETSKYRAALDHAIDSLIVAAIPECCSSGVVHGGYSLSYSNTEPRELTRTLKLLDLMLLTGRTHHSSQLIAMVSQPQGSLQERYQRFLTLLVSKINRRYRNYSRSVFPVLDAFLRALVERWLQDLLGVPSKRPAPLIKKLTCGCQDCTKVNKFLESEAVTDTFWAAQTRRSHVESNLRTLSGAVTVTTITRGSPHGLQVTKTQGTSAMDSGRVERARAFLSLVGTPDELARIMGDRYRDVQAALAGTKPYKIGSTRAPVVAPAENTPIASTSTGSGTQTRPTVAGTKRKAESDPVIDLTSD